MNFNNLILVGVCGHCKLVIEVAKSAGWSIIGILDVAKNVEKQVLDYPIVGTDEQIPEFFRKASF